MIVVQTGVDPELSAEVSDRGPSHSDGDGSQDGREQDAHEADGLVERRVHQEHQDDCTRLQEESDARRSDRGYGRPFLFVGSAKYEWVEPRTPAHQQENPSENLHQDPSTVVRRSSLPPSYQTYLEGRAARMGRLQVPASVGLLWGRKNCSNVRGSTWKAIFCPVTGDRRTSRWPAATPPWRSTVRCGVIFWQPVWPL